MSQSVVDQQIASILNEASLLSVVPEIDPLYEPYGHHDDYQAIIRSKQFFPLSLVGLSGAGKTFTISQICAREGIELVRANITEDTDEDDLMGGYRLRNDETVFVLGPVPVAQLRGATLLLDEFDLATPKIACLHPVLEGKPVVIKKIGMTITPAPGFNVITTSNTKGLGDLDGRFVGTHVQNEAFLDRLAATYEHDYPPIDVETRILCKAYTLAGYTLDANAQEFFAVLAAWAEKVRKTYLAGGIGHIITTRRLVHVVNAFGIFNGDQVKAMWAIVRRFDPKTVDALLDFFNILAQRTTTASAEATVEGFSDIPF